MSVASMLCSSVVFPYTGLADDIEVSATVLDTERDDPLVIAEPHPPKNDAPFFFRVKFQGRFQLPELRGLHPYGLGGGGRRVPERGEFFVGEEEGTALPVGGLASTHRARDERRQS